ncbi:MAG: hypothetical protein ACQCN6_03375 [Candidatus Bathyarchaeia archaeon]
MKKHLLLLISTLLLAILVGVFVFEHLSLTGSENSPCYVGVAFGGDTVEQAKQLIDRTKSYTNLFILQSGPISINETATAEICDYAVDAGQSLIVYFGDLDPRILEQKNLTWRATWVSNAKQAYGDRFFGVYYYDERGGIYLDSDKSAWPPLSFDETYDSKASEFEDRMLRDGGTIFLKDEGVSMFCSDYALYWWDYRSGYDVVFAELGWNHTTAKDIALVRGAATCQHKEWGAIVTWKHPLTAELESGDVIYSQMASAYRAGAKYISIFNYPYNGSAYGIMQDEHFEALQKLWTDITTGKVTRDTPAEAVLILPRNYGYGLRYPEDKIWGFWGPDDKSATVWSSVEALLDRYDCGLDIAYEDSDFAVPSGYASVYYWNSTV